MPAFRLAIAFLLIVSLLGVPCFVHAAPSAENREKPTAEEKQSERKQDTKKQQSKESDDKKPDPKQADQKHQAKNNDDRNSKKSSKEKQSKKKRDDDRNEKKRDDKQNSSDEKSQKKQADKAKAKKQEVSEEKRNRDSKQAPPQKDESRDEESPQETSKPKQPTPKSDTSQADKPAEAEEELESKQKPSIASPKRQSGEPTPATRPMEETSKAEAPAETKRKSRSALTEKPAPKPAEKKEEKKIDRKKFAITDLARVDEDFWLQGEYYGQLRRPDGVLETAGIQVVARGDGQFIARQLRGGLPGNGWDNANTIELSGQREGGRLVLRHERGFQVAIENNKATVSNSSGNTLGILTKVQRQSKMIGLQPSDRAIVLFDGTSTDHFVNAQVDENGLLRIGTVTKEPVQDFRLHLEFRLPYMPYALGQGRSNSGVYIQERYEVQILDSFGLPSAFNDCGSLYRTKPPEVNMCFPPLVWQSYDVYFTAARFDGAGNKIFPARISVLHNGILVHDNYLIPDKTGAGKPEGPEPRPIKLQDHGNPVVFRNVWIERPEVAAEQTVVAAERLDDSVELIPAGEPLPRP